MKKGSISKSLAILVIVVMIFALAGCGSNATQSNNGDNQQQSQQSSSGNSKIDDLYKQVASLQGEDALKFFQGLKDKGLTDSEILDFFINLPISGANKQIAKLYKDEDFQMYSESYPKGETYNGYQWKLGSGTKITGSYSKNDLKLPFTDYLPLPQGPVGDPNKKYKIGVAFHGFSLPWLANWADTAKWEADKHPNVELVIQDGLFDDNKWASIMDTFIAQKVDGILVWPQVEAPTGPPVARAIEAGIPVVSVDRTTGDKDITARVTGNFPANGAQAGMYAIWKLAQEGNLNAQVVMLRKPLGSTADAVRTGHFLKVLSYFPGIQILQSYHDNDSRDVAFTNAQTALQAFPNIDIFFGTGDHEALAALDATKMANRMNSRKDGKKILFLSMDDSKEAVSQVVNGLFEVNTPYTPLIADVGMRVLLNIVTKTGKMPQDIITPNIPMITQKGDIIFGMQTQKPDQWYEYTFGSPLK